MFAVLVEQEKSLGFRGKRERKNGAQAVRSLVMRFLLVSQKSAVFLSSRMWQTEGTYILPPEKWHLPLRERLWDSTDQYNMAEVMLCWRST